jgi:hypothetical protein
MRLSPSLCFIGAMSTGYMLLSLNASFPIHQLPFAVLSILSVAPWFVLFVKSCKETEQ